MPKGDPFTALCRQAARLTRRVAADLHLHTTASDGSFTPSQVVAFARAARLDAIAITDHDTFAGVAAAVDAAAGSGVRVIPGVEVTAEWDGREVHVLGLIPGEPGPQGPRVECPGAFLPHPPTLRSGFAQNRLASRLHELCHRRRDRFRDFIRLLRDAGHPLDDGMVSLTEESAVSLGRRHVAELLVRTGLARNYGEGWGRFVAPLGGKVLPKLKIPLGEAAELIRAAGGVSVLAHPPTDLSESELGRMKDAGLHGVETKFPAAGVGRTATLTAWAGRLGLLSTGGSDCHGPGGRPVGAVGATAEEVRAVCDAPVDGVAH
jgi:3',5'-nucleoside bisphosphate phosphatase